MAQPQALPSRNSESYGRERRAQGACREEAGRRAADLRTRPRAAKGAEEGPGAARG